MNDTMHLELDHVEGCLPRVIGLIERRGFIIDALSMRTGNQGRVLSLTIRPRDGARCLHVLGRQIDRLYSQIVEFEPRYAVVVDAQAARQLETQLRESGVRTTVLSGERSLEEVAAHPDAHCVMAAIVGIAGLRASLAAVVAGKQVLLANKEALVTAGPVFMAAVRRHGAALIPIDSEHNAIFQVFDAEQRTAVDKLILTASGGPFRNWSLSDMADATREQALAHPNWDMGAKISIDSATMMNKGLELIEAHLLFGLPGEQIDIVVHPQSVIHSMVAYRDGSVLAQMGTPDMRVPISHTLGWPARIDSPAVRLDFTALSPLTFEQPDSGRFPSLRLARQALAIGGSAPIVLNAANEVAVAAFLSGRIGFLDIARVVEDVLMADGNLSSAVEGLQYVQNTDRKAREMAESAVQNHALTN